MDNRIASLRQEDIESVRRAAASVEPIAGLTHTFYRYPARFSPQFVRAAISSFTKPGDLVLDPFMGGGTTLVEALASGRHAIGTDISSLATFIAKTKTTLLSKRDRQVLYAWADTVPSKIRINRAPTTRCTPQDVKYQKNIDDSTSWRIRKAIKLGLESLETLRNIRQENFARCVLLKTSQWALDGRKEIPTIQSYRETLVRHFEEMIQGERALYDSVREISNSPMRASRKAIQCINRSAIGIDKDNSVRSSPPPKLILTSPPYPGIHVLYHRWQVNGRRETPTPFWIANKLDGAGASFYTLGDRKQKRLDGYFSQIADAFESLAAISASDTVFIQMVSFSEPRWQLPRYLECLERAGLKEIHPSQIGNSKQGRIWRDVPQRKWHANFIGKTQGSKEVVLFHMRNEA